VRYLKLGRRACGWCHRLKVSRALAAGATWTSRTAGAPWETRSRHTSVIDAAGAIYVIGGFKYVTSSFTYYFDDVWASTDGGARPDFVGDSRVVHQGVLGGTMGYYRGTKAY
jgi:hypothetical protein